MSAPSPQPTIDDQRAEVRLTLRRISAAWQDRRYQELATLFDEHIIMVLPGLSVWEMTWISGGISESAAGYDVFTFARRTDGDQAWRAVWRTMALDVPPEDVATDE